MTPEYERNYREVIAKQIAEIGETETLERLQESGYWQASTELVDQERNYAFPVSSWQEAVEQIEPVITGTFVDGYLTRRQLDRAYHVLDRLEYGDELNLEIGDARFVIVQIAPTRHEGYDFDEHRGQGLTP